MRHLLRKILGMPKCTLVSAKDSPWWIKLLSDFRCNGINDEEEIQKAIDKGRDVHLNGTFFISEPVVSRPGKWGRIKSKKDLYQSVGYNPKRQIWNHSPRWI